MQCTRNANVENERAWSHTNGCNRGGAECGDADNDNDTTMIRIDKKLSNEKKVRTSRTRPQANARRLLLRRSKRHVCLFRTKTDECKS